MLLNSVADVVGKRPDAFRDEERRGGAAEDVDFGPENEFVGAVDFGAENEFVGGLAETTFAGSDDFPTTVFVVDFGATVFVVDFGAENDGGLPAPPVDLAALKLVDDFGGADLFTPPVTAPPVTAPPVTGSVGGASVVGDLMTVVGPLLRLELFLMRGLPDGFLVGGREAWGSTTSEGAAVVLGVTSVVLGVTSDVLDVMVVEGFLDIGGLAGVGVPSLELLT